MFSAIMWARRVQVAELNSKLTHFNCQNIDNDEQAISTPVESDYIVIVAELSVHAKVIQGQGQRTVTCAVA